MQLSAEDKKIVRILEGDVGVEPAPFAPLARRAGLPEEVFLRRVRALKRRGVIRRFGAILRHKEAGVQGNVMAVWRVPEGEIGRIGGIMASFPEVTHCYQRPALLEWPYNLYTMLHGPDEKHCRRLARKIAQATGVRSFRLLFSKREHKKSSMRYFS